MRQKLVATAIPREEPSLFVVEKDCPAWMATVPTLQRSEKDPDDVDTNGVDHAYDATRYGLRFDRTPAIRSRRI